MTEQSKKTPNTEKNSPTLFDMYGPGLLPVLLDQPLEEKGENQIVLEALTALEPAAETTPALRFFDPQPTESSTGFLSTQNSLPGSSLPSFNSFFAANVTSYNTISEGFSLYRPDTLGLGRDFGFLTTSASFSAPDISIGLLAFFELLPDISLASIVIIDPITPPTPEPEVVLLEPRDFVLTSSIGEIPPTDPAENWVSENGVYLVGGRGKMTLNGTDERDVLEAQESGRKTLKGGEGDDVYLIFGKAKIVENADEGFDWITKEGGSITLPKNVEGFFNHSDIVNKNINGNSLDNILIGGLSEGEKLNGKSGDDVLYGGGSGGDRLIGGNGDDLLYWTTGDVLAHGGRGTDTLKLVAGQSIVMTRSNTKKLELIEMRDEDSRSESVALDIKDIIKLSDNNDLFIFGDAGEDEVTVTGDITREDNVEAFGEIFAHFTAHKAGDLFVQIGLELNGSELV